MSFSLYENQADVVYCASYSTDHLFFNTTETDYWYRNVFWTT